MVYSVKDNMRDNIVDIARQIFSRYGFKKTTVDEIAHAARKGKSSIYYYFKSKEDIFKAVVEKEADILTKEINMAIEKAETPKDKLKAHILTRMMSFKKLANFYDAVKNEYLSHLDFIEKIRVRYDQEEVNTIKSIIELGINSGTFKVKNPEIASLAIATALKGLEIPIFMYKKNYNIEERIDDILDVVFYGLIKR